MGDVLLVPPLVYSHTLTQFLYSKQHDFEDSNRFLCALPLGASLIRTVWSVAIPLTVIAALLYQTDTNSHSRILLDKGLVECVCVCEQKWTVTEYQVKISSVIDSATISPAARHLFFQKSVVSLHTDSARLPALLLAHIPATLLNNKHVRKTPRIPP